MKYVIKNPKNQKNNVWFYNIFLGNITKKVKHPEKEKVNWILDLDETEIQELKNRGAELYKFNNSSDKSSSDSNPPIFKDAFSALRNVFEKAMKDSDVKKKVRKFLSDNDGNPSDEYKTIIKTIKLIEEENNNE